MPETHGVGPGMGHEGDPGSFVIHVPERRKASGSGASDVSEEFGEATDDTLMKFDERFGAGDRFPLFVQWPLSLFGEGFLDDLGRSSLPNRSSDLGDPIVRFGFEPECVNERLGGLLGADQGRDDQTINGEIGEDRREEVSLKLPDFGEDGIIDTTPVKFPLRLSVTDEDQFHGPFIVSAATGSTAMAVGPTTPVPVAAEIRGIDGDGDEMAGPRGDVTVATRTQISLGRFVGLHSTHVDLEPHWVMFGVGCHINRTRPR